MEITDMVLIPIIIGLVDALKGYGLPKKWWPVVSVLLGLCGGVFYLFPGDWTSGVLSGLVMGLSAGGLYSGGRLLLILKAVPGTHTIPTQFT